MLRQPVYKCLHYPIFYSTCLLQIKKKDSCNFFYISELLKFQLIFWMGQLAFPVEMLSPQFISSMGMHFCCSSRLNWDSCWTCCCFSLCICFTYFYKMSSLLQSPSSALLHKREQLSQLVQDYTGKFSFLSKARMTVLSNVLSMVAAPKSN